MKKLNLICNVKYATLHSGYQLAMIVMMVYSTVFMLYLGLSDFAIGIVLAIANLSAAILQPALGNFLDKRKQISVQYFSLGLLGAAMILSLVLLFIQRYTWPAIVCFVVIFSLITCIQPMINAISFLLEQRGIFVNFGLGRGVGSLSFAIGSSLLGVVLLHMSTGMLPVVYILFFAVIGVGMFSLRKYGPTEKTTAENAEDESEKALPLGLFLQTYRRYVLFLFGCLLMGIFFFASGNFFTIHIVTAIGGGTKEMGFATAIAATVELPAMILSNYLMKKIPVHRLLRMASFFFVVKFFLLMTAASIPMFYVSQLFQFFSFGFFFPCAVAYTGQILPKADLVKGQSLFTTTLSIAGVFSSLAGGILLGFTSVEFMLKMLFVLAVIGIVIMICSVQKCEVPASN